jgi:hypothetical protein
VLQGWEVLAYNLLTQRVLSPAEVANAVDTIGSSPAGVAVMLLFLCSALAGCSQPSIHFGGRGLSHGPLY